MAKVVDAALQIGEQTLAIDSKFSMENFRLFKEAKTDEGGRRSEENVFEDVKKTN